VSTGCQATSGQCFAKEGQEVLRTLKGWSSDPMLVLDEVQGPDTLLGHLLSQDVILLPSYLSALLVGDDGGSGTTRPHIR
jgi:hypothetical protein